MKACPFIIIFIIIVSCQAQERNPNRIVGGPCEGCEALLEYKDERALTSTDTLPGFLIHEPQLKIVGTVYKKNKRTPVPNVIVYIYHTDRDGLYSNTTGEIGWGLRHGSNRGWAKTDEQGHYSFYTFLPAPYPSLHEPVHIHMTIKEEGLNPYYIDEIVFDSDTLLTEPSRFDLKNRGGSGITYLGIADGMALAYRDIYLGYNIPDYE